MDGFSFDFSHDKPRISEPIPGGTKLLVRMSYAPGGVGPNGQLTAAKESDAQYLKAEFTVLRGPYKGRKIFESMTVAGGKVDEKGRSIAAGITRATIRTILDASAGVSSKDEGPEAAAKRVLPNGFADLQGRSFVIKVGFDPEKSEKDALGNITRTFPAKNRLGQVLTVDHKDYPKSEDELDNLPRSDATLATPTLPTPAWGAPVQAPVNPTLTATVTAPQPFAAASVSAPSNLAPIATAAAAREGQTVAADNGLPAWMK